MQVFLTLHNKAMTNLSIKHQTYHFFCIRNFDQGLDLNDDQGLGLNVDQGLGLNVDEGFRSKC